MSKVIGYSIVIDGGDGSSSTHFYQNKDAAQSHLDWEMENIGYLGGGDEITEVTLDDFKKEFTPPW